MFATRILIRPKVHQLTAMDTTPTRASDALAARPAERIWWSNAVFFLLIHVAALLGVFWYPPGSVPITTLLLAVLSWQLAEFG